MKRFALALTMSLAAGSLVFADSTPAQKTPASKPATATHVKHTTHHATAHHVAAEVTSVDLQKSTLSFKNEKGETLTWPAEGKALASLKTLKTGDKVTVVYSVDTKGAPKAATEITPAAAAKTSSATKPSPEVATRTAQK
jgi:Cu/Ag efflux protein CusF